MHYRRRVSYLSREVRYVAVVKTSTVWSYISFALPAAAAAVGGYISQHVRHMSRTHTGVLPSTHNE